MQVPLRSYGGFFFTPSQPSSVNTHPGEILKNPELSRHASIIHILFSARNVVWGNSFLSRLDVQATKTIPEIPIRRRTTSPSIVDWCLQCHLHSRNGRSVTHNTLQFDYLMAKIQNLHPSRLYPSSTSSCKLVLISLTSIPKKCLPNFCATISILPRVFTLSRASIWRPTGARD